MIFSRTDGDVGMPNQGETMLTGKSARSRIPSHKHDPRAIWEVRSRPDHLRLHEVRPLVPRLIHLQGDSLK